jgi:hypothetical protein
MDLLGRQTSEEKITRSDGQGEKWMGSVTVVVKTGGQDGFAPLRPPGWLGSVSTFIGRICSRT